RAYINVFDATFNHASYQPAWIFPHQLGNSTKAIAEAVSHEVGHNFGLQHDGTSTLGYYSGHANWAPIMGTGYSRPVVQWSAGEYAGANNTAQDDVAIIAAKAPYRADEAGSTVATAAATLPAPGYITSRNDLDTFALGTCSGAVSLTATPAPTSPDLDIRLELLDSAGGLVAADDPASGGSGDTATGLGAALSQGVPSGLYFARVDGVGNGTGATGYTDYASIGAYTLTWTGCTTGASAPGQPTGLTVTPAADGRSATVSWSAPAADGGSAVTSYTAGRTGAADETLTGLSTTWTGLTPGATYTFTVRATNALGTGEAASLQRSMPTLPSTPSTPSGPSIPKPPAAAGVPFAPTTVQASSGAKGGRTTVSVRWSAAVDGGSPITGYRLLALQRDRVVTTFKLGATARSRTVRLPRGRYVFVVVAVNAIGDGPRSVRTRIVSAR
ncbi:MAG TPA: hypothetical protein DEQ43_00940, partial [Nocardioides bacterium]|nr:hypothetical protein [Nocardioides sp.]